MCQVLPDERGHELSHSWLPMSERDGRSDNGEQGEKRIDVGRAGEAPTATDVRAL